MEPRRIKALEGVVPQDTNLDPNFTAFATAAQAFPLTHAVALMRGLALSTLEPSLLLDRLYLLGFIAVFFIATVHLMRKRLIK